eukprot:6179714-Pleurochrysis_carterae.AAC.2
MLLGDCTFRAFVKMVEREHEEAPSGPRYPLWYCYVIHAWVDLHHTLGSRLKIRLRRWLPCNTVAALFFGCVKDEAGIWHMYTQPGLNTGLVAGPRRGMAIYIGALIGGIDENGELRSPILNAADLRVALAALNVCAVALDLVVWRGSHGAPSAREHHRPEQPSETATCTGCWSTINGTVLGAAGQGPSARIAAVDNQRLPTSIECLPDPPHPTCRGHNATRERKPQIVISTPDVHDSLLQRFALVYFGTVSRRARGHSSGDISDADLPEEFFVNVTICWQSLQRHPMDPSSGRANFDIFLHTWVRSTQLQSRMLALFQPISAKLEPSNHSVWGPQFKREAALSTVSFNEAS